MIDLYECNSLTKISKNILSKLSLKYDICKPDFCFGVTSDIKNIGEFRYYDYCIIINPNTIEISEFENVIYHEFRHAWQYITHPDIYFWWLDSRKRHLYSKY